MARRGRSRRGGGLGIAVVLVIAAVGAVWIAQTVSSPGSDDGTRSRNPLESLLGRDDPDPAQDEPSGWGPAVAVTTDDATSLDLAGTADQVALATLAATVAKAPVVVTVDQTAGATFDAAVDLADQLRAPLLLATVPSSTSTSSPSSPASSSSPVGTAPAATTSAPPDASDGVPSTAGLLDAWATDHVVAIGVPPDTAATVHAVEVDVVASPSPSTTPAGPSATPSATASSGPAEVDVTLPDQVTAMVEDARRSSPDEAASTGPGEATAPPSSAPASPTGSPATRATEPPATGTTPVVVVRRAGPDTLAIRGDVASTLRTLDIDVAPWTEDDPRRDDGLQAVLRGAPAGWIIAVPDDDRPAPASTDWAGLVRTAATAPQLPGGGLVLFPGRVFVATYGNPRGAALGVLGERDVAGSIAYTEDLAAQYDGLFGPDVQVQPAFEIIVTIASGEPQPTGDYSRREDLGLVTEWVDAATEAGLYVVLDLQPGRTDFLTQAQEIEELLVRPNVGLALDPEWRLEPDEFHIDQIGSVTTAEVNQVTEWLADLVVANNLPQKLLVVHNFRLDMTTDRDQLVDHPELATMFHVDGQGQQANKDATYASITGAGPDFVWWGWKNFFDEDVPGIRSPQDTAAITPQPNFITYQ